MNSLTTVHFSKRRALKPDEMVRLIESARTSKVRVEGYRGELWARLYTVAFFTGLRRGELASLTPRSFKLAGEHSTDGCGLFEASSGGRAAPPSRPGCPAP